MRCLLLFLLLALRVDAATINAASASQADVAAAVTEASSGDTVTVPAGTETWASGVTTGVKVIHFVGAGEGLTVITRTTADAETFTLASDGSTIRGFTLNTFGSGVIVRANDTVVSGCTFANSVGGTMKKAVYYDGRSYSGGWYKGLVYDCTITGLHCHTQGNGYQTGSGWTTVPGATWYTKPLGLGTADAMYVEDCTFAMSIQGNVIDAEYGGAYVFRYNTVTVNSGVSGSPIECHGVYSVAERATRKWEIYQNSVRGVASNFRPLFIRGGTGVIFNNLFWGTGWSFANAQGATDQAGRNHPATGSSDIGGQLHDGNTPDESGTHNGGDNSATLIDTTKNWSPNPNKWKPSGGYMVYNVTKGAYGRATASTDNTVTVTLSGGADFDNGDSYIITDGYPLRDQIGMGTDDSLATALNPYPTQTREPAYIWNNIYDADGVLPAGQATWSVTYSGYYTILNTDLFLNSGAKPGYTPYTYPHPLRAETPSTRNPGRKAKAGRVIGN